MPRSKSAATLRAAKGRSDVSGLSGSASGLLSARSNPSPESLSHREFSPFLDPP